MESEQSDVIKEPPSQVDKVSCWTDNKKQNSRMGEREEAEGLVTRLFNEVFTVIYGSDRILF